jgi:hypothetical protein
MNRTYHLAVAWGLLILGAGVVRADPVVVQCPERLSVNETTIAVGNWQVFVSSNPYAFSRLRLYNGHPQGSIVLDADNAADEQASNYRWTLGSAGDNLWVECAYHASAVRLVQQLPKGLHSCRAQKSETSMGLSCE